MKVLITGATGFIGSHLAEQLHARGHTIRCLVRPTSNRKWIRHLSFEEAHGDFSDHTSLVKSLEGVDYVYHVAGVTKAKKRQTYFEGNHLATAALLRAVREGGTKLKRFVHVSSQAAVGPSLDGSPVTEATPFHPITTYGISKMEAEKECLSCMKDVPITITRPPAVYGPRDTDVFEFFNTMNKGLQPMIGFQDTYASLIHVTDLARGIIMAGEHSSSVGQTYFISSKRSYNWKEIGDITASIMGKRALRVRIPVFATYIVAAFAEFGALFSSKPALLNFEKIKDITQDAWTCDASKAGRELGFEQKIELEEGIRETVEWYRNEKWL